MEPKSMNAEWRQIWSLWAWSVANKDCKGLWTLELHRGSSKLNALVLWLCDPALCTNIIAFLKWFLLLCCLLLMCWLVGFETQVQDLFDSYAMDQPWWWLACKNDYLCNSCVSILLHSGIVLHHVAFADCCTTCWQQVCTQAGFVLFGLHLWYVSTNATFTFTLYHKGTILQGYHIHTIVHIVYYMYSARFLTACALSTNDAQPGHSASVHKTCHRLS